MTNEELAAAIQSGQHEYTLQLWEQCYKFIRKKAYGWLRAWNKRTGYDLDDLTQSGFIALCEAVDKFQEGKGSFLTILSFTLSSEFASVAGVRTSKIDPLTRALSLEQPAKGDPDGLTIGDTIAAEDELEELDERISAEQIADIIWESIKILSEKQHKAIRLHFKNGKTYKEIADLLGCSVGSASQAVRYGLYKLRTGKAAPTLSELYYHGECNPCRNTGLTFFKEKGCSSPEYELLRKEYLFKKHRYTETRESKIRYCVERLGMDPERAKRIFPA